MLFILSFLVYISMSYSKAVTPFKTTNEIQQKRHPSRRFLQQCRVNEETNSISCCENGQCADCTPSEDGLSLQCCTDGFCLFCEYDESDPDAVACCDESSNCFECSGDECCYIDNSGLETCCTGNFNGNVECCINDVFCFQEICESDAEDMYSCSCTARLNGTGCNSCEVCDNMSFGVTCDNVEQGFNVGC